MKAILATAALVTISWLGSAPLAEARGFESRVYISSYLPCGTPVYTERYFVGYNRWGNPVWATRVVRPAYRPVVRPVYVAPCPPPPRYVAPCPPRYVAPCPPRGYRSGVNFSVQGSFPL